MGCSAYKVRYVLCLLVKNDLASNDLLLNILCEVLQHGFVYFRGGGFEVEILVLQDCRPIRHILIFFGPKEPYLLEPVKLLISRYLIDVCFLCIL